MCGQSWKWLKTGTESIKKKVKIFLKNSLEVWDSGCLSHEYKCFWTIIPRPKNRKFSEVKRDLVDYIHEVQCDGCKLSLNKHHFKACEINCSAEIPRTDFKTSQDDLNQVYVYSKNKYTFFDSLGFCMTSYWVNFSHLVTL